MKLIVGLGNPGKKYEKNRHNAGFMLVDFIYKKLTTDNLQLTTSWKKKKRCLSVIAEFKQDNTNLILAKPQTFMNNSGLAVQALTNNFNLTTDNLFVIHDDFDIALGKYKIQSNRGPSGHNGIKSIIDHLGTQDFTRIRLGIRPDSLQISNVETEKFVLKNFSQAEIDVLDSLFSEITQTILRGVPPRSS